MTGSGVARMWIEKVESPDPAEREAGIRGLELLGDPATLPVLAEVFATDPEPALRVLAQAVGKAIYYGVIRQQLERPGSSDEERRQAAEILARAQEKKTKHKRRK